MNHTEDAQPNESVHGRPKRLLPFVKDTSRSQGQGKGRGGGKVRKGGRGQDEGPGLSHGAFIPGLSRAGPALGSASTPGSSRHPLPPKPQWMSKSERLGATGSATLTSAPGNVLTSGRTVDQPRRRKFHPKMKDRPRPDESSAPNRDTLEHASSSHLDFNANTPSHVIDPPAKRRRLDDTHVTTTGPISASTPTVGRVKLEEPTEPSLDSSSGQATNGTKFITYDKYPQCRFSCGRPPDEVRNNRKSIKGVQVLALQKQGFVVDAVFIRDDGIAIDWSLPNVSEVDQPTSSAAMPVSQLESRSDALQTAPNPALSLQYDTSRLSNPLPPQLDSITTSARSPSVQCPTTPIIIENAYREVAIPPRCLPLRGDTRSLEIWVVEQMHLLDAELGPGLDLQLELLGIGEYLTGQPVPTNITPCVRMRYARPMPLVPPLEESQDSTIQTASINTDSTIRDANRSPTATTSSTHAINAIPPIAYLPRSPSPAPCDNDAPTVKVEKDELALDPPSPCLTPHLALPDVPSTEAERANLPPNPSFAHSMSTQTPSNEDTPNAHTLSSDDEPQQSGAASATANMEVIQQLRRDLEASRLEAERKHRDLEQRILELSCEQLEGGMPKETLSSVFSRTNADSQVRIVDESKPNLLVLRRGKHDKTRRLLAPSQSTALHVSWLGVMQLVDHNTRQIVATGFEEGAPDSISVEDACLLSESSAALALAGDGCQLGITSLGEKSFKYLPLSGRPHEPKGICTVTPINLGEVVTLGHDRCYVHWRFGQNMCSTTPLSIPKLHQCTALAYTPFGNNILTAGSDSGKRSKLSLYNLLDSQHIATTVDLSNHVHHIHIDAENPSLMILELARLDDQFQVHDMRQPIYQSVQKFGYQTVVHEKGAFRTRGNMRGHFFSRGDAGIVRAWDRRNLSTYQTIPVIPYQKVVDVVLNGRSLVCATESHHVVSYPTF
ncbi:hypothetical protein FRC07_004000 [Ceratobasidium sp. 392]|nr:hypothetical protein FRC07_004000 [Ceratobasidium sp. 392]